MGKANDAIDGGAGRGPDDVRHASAHGRPANCPLISHRLQMCLGVSHTAKLETNRVARCCSALRRGVAHPEKSSHPHRETRSEPINKKRPANTLHIPNFRYPALRCRARLPPDDNAPVVIVLLQKAHPLSSVYPPLLQDLSKVTFPALSLSPQSLSDSPTKQRGYLITPCTCDAKYMCCCLRQYYVPSVGLAIRWESTLAVAAGPGRSCDTWCMMALPLLASFVRPEPKGASPMGLSRISLVIGGHYTYTLPWYTPWEGSAHAPEHIPTLSHLSHSISFPSHFPARICTFGGGGSFANKSNTHSNSILCASILPAHKMTSTYTTRRSWRAERQYTQGCNLRAPNPKHNHRLDGGHPDLRHPSSPASPCSFSPSLCHRHGNDIVEETRCTHSSA